MDSDQDPKKPRKASPERSGKIGPYELIERIGEGGMGDVYLAWHPEPVRRKVALKVIKVGMNTREVVARFESERQALALMEHPYIARILDGGSTEDGLPYFAMEYVPGVPITEYCDRHRLSVRDRLELMRKVCEAVQHAHHRAIVHRDLKPSNILVSGQDGQPIPKVIDFGIAKALREPLGDRTAHTKLGQFLGTPKYMSPEQVDPASHSVDTRSDVYSLGVILYELLVGLTPLDETKATSTPLDELIRKVREEEPERPSKRVGKLGLAAKDIARKRATLSGNLRSNLEGELDWITLKALEKQRSRRYGSPSELADDLQRYLQDEVVLARPPSLGYRTAKFVRRHKASVAIVLLLFLSLLGFAVTMTIQAERIARERDRANQEAETARQVSEFLTNLFQLSDPMVARGQQPTAREILDRGARRIESELSGQPTLLARLQSTMALAYENLGLYNQAETLYGSALARQAEATGADGTEALLLQASLANLHWRQGKLEQSERELKETIQALLARLGEDDPATLRVRGNLGSLYLVQGRYAEAKEIYQDCLEKMRRILGEHNPQTMGIANNLSLVLSELGETEEAEKLYLWVLETRRRENGSDHPHTLGAAANLAEHYSGLDRLEEAEQLHMDVLERRRRVLGEDHPDTLTSLNSLGNLYLAKGDLTRAEEFLRNAYQGRTRVLGDLHSDTLATSYGLGRLLMARSRIAEARQLIVQAIQGWVELFGPGHPNVLTAKAGLARAYYAEGKFAEAEKLFQEEAQGWQEYTEAHPRALAALFNLACVRALQGRRGPALESLREIVRLGYRDAASFDDPDLASLRSDEEFQKLVQTVRADSSR